MIGLKLLSHIAILKDHTLTLHGTQSVMDKFHENLLKDFSKMRMVLDELDPVRDHRVWENGIQVTSMAANHDCPGAVNYIFTMPDGFTFFIETDSGVFGEETWAISREFHFDLIVLDGTAGKPDSVGSHHTAKQVAEAVKRFRDEKIIDSGTRLVTNHFAHCGGMLHTNLEAFYHPLGIEVEYDGMVIKLASNKKAMHEIFFIGGGHKIKLPK